jgi:hypothetical protein
MEKSRTGTDPNQFGNWWGTLYYAVYGEEPHRNRSQSVRKLVRDFVLRSVWRRATQEQIPISSEIGEGLCTTQCMEKSHTGTDPNQFGNWWGTLYHAVYGEEPHRNRSQSVRKLVRDFVLRCVWKRVAQKQIPISSEIGEGLRTGARLIIRRSKIKKIQSFLGSLTVMLTIIPIRLNLWLRSIITRIVILFARYYRMRTCI